MSSTNETITRYNEKSVLEVETMGFVIEAAAGIAVAVLAIIGLVRGDTGLITSIAGIVFGAALLAQGTAIAREYSSLLRMMAPGRYNAAILGSGITVEILAGCSAAVLGILALLGFYPETLMAVSVIVGGAALVLDAAGLERLNNLKAHVAGLTDLGEKIAHGAVSGAIAAQVLAGAGAVVLGILALTMPLHSEVLTLTGLLVLRRRYDVQRRRFYGPDVPDVPLRLKRDGAVRRSGTWDAICRFAFLKTKNRRGGGPMRRISLAPV